MLKRFDVVVLGCGVAGTAAAIAAAKRGAHACVIAGGPGGTALFAGAWRGDCPDGLRAALAGVGYSLHSCSSALPHPYGHLVPCTLAPPAQLEASLTTDTAVIGIAGLPGFDASALARQWSARFDARLTSFTLELPSTPPAGWAPASLAGQIERQPNMIIEALATALKRSGARRAILPAVLGAKPNDELRQSIASALGAPVGEALGVPPSLPGWRLHNALRMALAEARVAIYDGKGLASTRRNGRIEEIELMNGDRVSGANFVLATGKFAAGGIEADVDFREPALGCPVWIEHLGEKFESVDSLILTHADRSEEQPLLQVGVHANEDYKPVNSLDDVFYDNVFVAGSVRAGWSVSERAIGDAAADGWAAGVRASA